MISDGMGSSDSVQVSLTAPKSKSYKISLIVEMINSEDESIDDIRKSLEEFYGKLDSIEEVPVVETNNSQGA